MELDPTFQSIRTHGIIGGMSPAAKHEVFELIKGRSFVNECHLCMEMLKESIWTKMVNVRGCDFRDKPEGPL
jgi:hypothetical protein